jgi:hypothetical protein
MAGRGRGQGEITGSVLVRWSRGAIYFSTLSSRTGRAEAGRGRGAGPDADGAFYYCSPSYFTVQLKPMQRWSALLAPGRDRRGDGRSTASSPSPSVCHGSERRCMQKRTKGKGEMLAHLGLGITEPCTRAAHLGPEQQQQQPRAPAPDSRGRPEREREKRDDRREEHGGGRWAYNERREDDEEGDGQG